MSMPNAALLADSVTIGQVQHERSAWLTEWVRVGVTNRRVGTDRLAQAVAELI